MNDPTGFAVSWLIAASVALPEATGASFTAVTRMLSDSFNVSTPPSAVPPESRTDHENVAGPPLPFAAAMNFMPCNSPSV